MTLIMIIRVKGGGLKSIFYSDDSHILANCVLKACQYYVGVQIVVLQQKQHMCCVIQPPGACNGVGHIALYRAEVWHPSNGQGWWAEGDNDYQG